MAVPNSPNQEQDVFASLISRRADKPRRHQCNRDLQAALLIKSCEKRARHKGIEFEISQDRLIQRLRRSDDRCEVSRLQFDYSPTQLAREHFKNPLRPSLDRVDNSRGYTTENVMVVLHCVNISINEWGTDFYLAVCRAVAEEQRAKKSAEFRSTRNTSAIPSTEPAPIGEP